MPPLIDRRRFLGLTASVLLASCGEIPKVPQPERKELPFLVGTVVEAGSRHYVSNGLKLYEIHDFQDWKRRTKFDQYGGVVIRKQESEIVVFEKDIPKPTPEIIDPFTGVNRINKPYGGEINLFFPGFLTDGSVPYGQMKPVLDTFAAIHNQGLSKKGWTTSDSFFFTYGKEALQEYTPSDTAKDPRESIKQAVVFVKKIMENMPMVRINLFGHSLGGNIALAVAKEFQDVINNVVLFAPPARGIEPTPERVEVLNRPEVQIALFAYLREKEKVSKYMFDLWQDAEYQKQLDLFTEQFVAKKKGLYVFGSTTDPIVNTEAMRLKGAKTHIVPMQSGKAFSLDPIGLLGHGAPLVDPYSVSQQPIIVGDNLGVG